MKFGLILAVAAIMAGLFAVDRFLAAVEAAELSREAENLDRTGDQLLAAGKPAQAVTPLRRAFMLRRDNRQYELSLVRALTESGRAGEAETHLRSLLARDSNDGPANLAMARLQVRLGHTQDADAFYHRALYGTWPSGHDNQAIRMELVEYLAGQGRHKELLPELLLLEDAAPKDQASATLAALFLKAGSPGRAAQVYSALIRKNPADAAAYRGLGETELAQGDFHRARVSFSGALRHDPDDATLKQRLDFATRLSQLDPTPRRLASREKFVRSNQILKLAENGLTACAKRPSGPDRAAPLVAQADQLLAATVKGAVSNEQSEARLDLAERMWRLQSELCSPAAPDNDPLPVIMHKLIQ